jgi:hypothetical protein
MNIPPTMSKVCQTIIVHIVGKKHIISGTKIMVWKKSFCAVPDIHNY